MTQSSSVLQPGAATHIPWFRQFRWTLILAFITLAVVPVAIVATLVVSQQIAQAESDVTAQLQSISELKAAQIENWLGEADRSMTLILADRDHRYNLLVEVATASVVDEAVLQDINGDLANMADADSGLEELIFYEPSGRVLAASSEVEIGKLVSAQPFYTPSLANASYTQPPFYQIGTNELAVYLTRAVTDNNGNVVGIFAAKANLDTLTELMLTDAAIGESGETYLVSRQNNYLLTPSKFEGYSQARAYTSDGIERALAGETGSGIYDTYREPAVPVIGFYTWLPELEVALLAETEQAEALAPARASQIASFALATVAVLLAAGVGLFVALRVTGPVADLTQVSRELAAGDLNARSHVNLRNEFGALSTSFNTMADRLQDSLGEAREATAMALEATRLKDLFLATMSHELRTPLNAIIGFLGLMIYSGELDEDNEHMGQRAISNANRLLGLINNILDLSRISSGRLEITPVHMSVKATAEALYSDLNFQAMEKGVAFNMMVDDILPETIVHDEERISQIVINLVNNAIKFTEKGQVDLSFLRRGSKLAVVVSDTGVGISPTKHELIFDEFVQVDSTSTRKHGGAGLGLSIVKRLAVLMDGTVSVTSDLNTGSTFTVELPLELVPSTLSVAVAQEGVI